MAKIAVTKEIHESYIGLRLTLPALDIVEAIPGRAEPGRDDTDSIDASVELA